MSKRAYSLVVVLFFCFGIVFQHDRNALGKEFVTVFVPALLLLNSLQWFLLPRSPWKAGGFCGSLLVFAALYFSYSSFEGDAFANFATFLLLFIAASGLAFWLLTADPAIRSISLSINLTTLFIVLLGSFLHIRGIVDFGFSAAGALLLGPLLALCLSVTGAAYNWPVAMQVGFLCTLVQIGVRLFDIGETNNLRWMSVCAALTGFIALGLTAYWAKDWNTDNI